MIKTDRSRIESYQRCPRRRWLEYEADRSTTEIGGYRPNKPAFALEIGSGFHKGMECLLSDIIPSKTHPEISRNWLDYTKDGQNCLIDVAVAAGIESYDKAILPYFEQVRDVPITISDEDSEVEDPEQQESFNNYTVNEGRALVEALIRVYVAAPAGLASLLEEYEILEVEQELDTPLDPCKECSGRGHEFAYDKIDTEGPPILMATMTGNDCKACGGAGGSVILMARPDGILRHRKDHQLYVLSFKTTGKWDKRKADAGKYDIEGISQLIAAEHKYGEPFAGVQMVYVVKGYKMKDKLDDVWKTYNGVTRPYMKHGITSEDDQFAFSYDYVKDTGEIGKLGKGWEKVNLWEQGQDAIKLWVEQLREGRWPKDKYGHVDHLDKMVIAPPPFWRDEETMEEWKQATAYQEKEIAHLAAGIQLARLTDSGLQAAKIGVNLGFPKYRHSCTYPLPCSFIPVCHEGATLIESGLYVAREANHPQENKK